MDPGERSTLADALAPDCPAASTASRSGEVIDAAIFRPCAQAFGTDGLPLVIPAAPDMAADAATRRTFGLPGVGPAALAALGMSGAEEARRPFVYEVWPHLGGKSRFLCRGRCMTGPRIDFWYNVCAWSCILLPTCVYFVVCADWLWAYVSPLMPIFTGILFVAAVFFLLLTSCTDPGIIPRRALQEVVERLDEEVAIATGAGLVGLDPETLEPDCRLSEEQTTLGYRWCPTCKVIRPPRSSHCRDCDNCVLTFDHHCPFVGNCVGQRNYGFFTGFLISVSCLGVAVAAGMGIYFVHGGRGHADGTQTLAPQALVPLLLALGTPTAALLLYVLGLGSFHAWLACRGRTTREVLTGRVTVNGSTLLRLRGPSLLRARDRVKYPMLSA